MEEYGKVIKIIRQQKGFLIKEVYSGILGRTTAYRFEQGTTNISTKKLQKVLKALGINSMDEFFYLYGRITGTQEPSVDKILNLILQREPLSFNHNNHQATLDFYLQHKNSKNREEQFYALLAHLDYYQNGTSPTIKFPEAFPKESKFMNDYLLSIESWTLRELDVFPFISICFTKEIRPLLMERFKKNFMSYRDYLEKWEIEYANHLINYVQISILIGYYEDLQEDIGEIEKLFDNYPKLHLYLLHKIRLLYLQTMRDAYFHKQLEVNCDIHKLQEIVKVLPENKELIAFYLDVLKTEIPKLFPEYRAYV